MSATAGGGAKQRDWPSRLFILAGLAAMALDGLASEAQAVGWWRGDVTLLATLFALAIAGWSAWRRLQGLAAAMILGLAFAAGTVAPLAAVSAGIEGRSAPALWLYVLSLGFLAWRAMDAFSAANPPQPAAQRLVSLLVPALFGLWLLYLWEVLVVGLAVPSVLLPPPSAIADVFGRSTSVLWADFQQTFIKAVIPGYLMGCGSGFLVALLVDRVPFLQRGLLPLGNFVSAIPIVGIAPIMVMWFGFDWQSKAAVVVIMTFFPMLVNAIAGLEASSAMERDLMRSYAASYWGTLLRLRLPNALPFLFNALKINSTLALIGAIVAEFFGTPIVGMGFRISTEVGRMNIDLVWASIAVAALAGSLFYGALAMLERALTFWHPSYRS